MLILIRMDNQNIPARRRWSRSRSSEWSADENETWKWDQRLGEKL